MNEQVDRFSKMAWEQVTELARQKLIEYESHKIRLLELTSGFHEQQWCMRRHTGYVISGSLEIEFTDHTDSFSQGDALLISLGEPHKARVTDEKCCLFLVDDA